jgi:hypothetical protein
MTRIAATLAIAFLLSGMGFGVKEYDAFHDLLHPLEHEAVPKNDFARIRSEAKELTRRGDAITRLGVPKGIKAGQVEEFKKHLNDFATRQCEQLLASGVPGIHFYTLNKAHSTTRVLKNLGLA